MFLVLGIVFIGLLVVFAIGVYGSLEITRIPYLAVPYQPADFGWPCEPVQFMSHDQLRLRGWFIRATEPSSHTIMIHHGIGSNAGDMLLNTVCLRKDGKWNLFYYNFRGHADSDGARTSLGPLELRDMESAVAFLTANYAKEAKHLAVYGHSLGAAVAIVGAARMKEIEAVAAESPFSSISKTVRHFSWIYYGIPYFPFIPLALLFTSWRLGLRIGNFAPADVIGDIAPRPLYLIFAERDLRMPLRDAEQLWAAAQEPKERWIVPGADHGEPWVVAREEYESRLIKFFGKVYHSNSN